MAGGIDWLRWHHGTATDAKFRLVAKRAQARVCEVLALWAVLMEAASQSVNRGDLGELDFEAIDCALDFDDGAAQRIYAAMTERRLISAGRLSAWEKRQPKREREDNSAERVAKHRAKSRHVTPCNAMSDQETPRGEESREDSSTTSASIHTGLTAAVGVFEGHDSPRETPNPVAAFAVALNHAGFSVTSLNPDLVAYVDEGGTVEHLVECARHKDCAGTKATYPIRMARRELKAKAAEVATGPPSRARPSKGNNSVHRILGVTHEPSHPDSPLVRDPDPRGPGDAARAEPRRLSGG